MGKTSNMSKMKAIVAGLMALGTAIAPASSATADAGSVQVRDQRAVKHKAPRPVTKHNGMPSFMGFTTGPVPYKMLNQRQYRKMCRQNPSMYRSKKHRSKN